MNRTRPAGGTDDPLDALRRWLEGRDAALAEWLEPRGREDRSARGP